MRDLGEEGHIAQVLLTLEKRQQRQLQCRLSGLVDDKVPLLIGRMIQGVDLLSAQEGCEAWACRPFDRSHRHSVPQEVSEKGSASQPSQGLLFQAARSIEILFEKV